MAKNTGKNWHQVRTLQDRARSADGSAERVPGRGDPKRRTSGDREPGRGEGHRAPASDDGVILLYGLHAVEAALANPARVITQLKVTLNAKPRIQVAADERGVDLTMVEATALDRLLPRDAVHQGVVLQTRALDVPDVTELAVDRLPEGRRALVLVLDQVTDPHNVGAILRSAAAFGAAALIMTARHSPRLDGALAKAASGALEAVPVLTVPNLARALETLADIGYFRIGLDGTGTTAFEDVDVLGPIAVVLGAESVGMRRLTVEHCDQICRISTTGSIASLNVSNAAAIALHSVRSRQRNV
jgi:23S rRNA (guanosine2251-2'-O)-methyltransferase